MAIEQSSPSPSTQQKSTDRCSAVEQESTQSAALCDTEEDVLQFAYRATATQAMLSRPLRQVTLTTESLAMDSPVATAAVAEEKGEGEEKLKVEDSDKQTESADETCNRNKSDDHDRGGCLAQRMGFAAVAVNGNDVDITNEGNTAGGNFADGDSIPTSQVCDHIINDNVVYAPLCCTRNDGVINNNHMAQTDMQGEMHRRKVYRKKINQADEQGAFDYSLGEITLDLRGGMTCICANNCIIIDNKVINGDTDCSIMKTSGISKVMNAINNINTIATIDKNNMSVTPVNYTRPQQGDLRGNKNNNTAMGRDTYDNQVRDHSAQSHISTTFSAKTAILGHASQQIHVAPCTTTFPIGI
ncbi:hypothetical protein BGX26_010393 [Mortierella sp. AD094]|nr:hypothetical protein BGX26_010393 [Mortierella sp. AD094]